MRVGKDYKGIQEKLLAKNESLVTRAYVICSPSVVANVRRIIEWWDGEDYKGIQEKLLAKKESLVRAYVICSCSIVANDLWNWMQVGEDYK